MAISKVAIANRALQKMGATRIEALDQDHPNARSISACYDILRDAELRRYPWSFAIKRESIAADATDSLWGGWNRYSLPNDFLRLIRDDELGDFVDWKIEGLYVLTSDASPLKIRYIARIDDPTFYDSLFIEAFASKMAYECCEEITASNQKKDALIRDYTLAVAEAKRNGAIEKAAQEFPEDEWLTARR